VPQIQGGSVKAIALLGLERVPVLPDLKTAHEQGLTDLDCSAWAGFAFPKGTPAAIVQRLNAAASEAADTPAVRERLEQVGVTVVARNRRSPDYLAKFIPAEIKKWAAVIRANGLAQE
jgi:tripartite-type tricarboxylate transporter receptor subunit TctC